MTNRQKRRAVAAILIALSAASPADSQTSTERPDRILQSAHGMLGKGLYDLAADEYRRYLDAAPPNPDTAEDRATAAYGLAVSLQRTGDRRAALEALDADPARPGHPFAAEARLLRGACLYELAEYDDASSALDSFLAEHTDHPAAPQAALMLVESLAALGQTRQQAQAAAAFLENWPDDNAAPRVRLLSGVALLALGRTDEAADQLGRVADSNAAEAPAAALRLARLLEDNADPRAADYYAQAQRAGDPDTASRAALAIARRQREAGDPRAASSALDRWLDQYETSDLAPSARLELGRALLDSGLPRQAIAPLERAADSDDAPDPDYWLAKARAAAGETHDAIAGFDALASDHPDHPLAPYALYDLAVVLRDTGEPALAADVLTRLRDAHPRHELLPHALYAHAAIDLDNADYEHAITRATRFLSAHASHELAPDAALLLADAQYFDTRYDDAVRTLRSLQRAAPEKEPAYTAYRLGMALERAGEHDDASKALASALADADSDQRLRPAALTIAQIAFASADYRTAVAAAQRYLAWGDDQPGATDAALTLGLALAQLDQHEDAIERFDDILTAPDGPLTAHATYAKAASLAALGRDDDAARLYNALLSRPDAGRFTPHAQRALGAIALEDARPDDARRWFALAAESGDTDPSDLVNLAQAALNTGDADAALEALDSPALHAAPEPVRTRAAVVEALARASNHDHRAAIRLIDTLLAAGSLDDPTADRLAYERALALRATGREDEAAQALSQLRRSDALADRATLELAAIAIEDDRLDDAAVALDTLLERRDRLEPAVRELALYRRGVVAHHAADPELAAQLLANFNADYPNSDAAVSADLIAGRSLSELGQHPRAAEHLERVVAADPPDDQLAPALLLLAESLAHAQRYDESLWAARAHLERFSASDLWFRARFAEAWALENLERTEEAISSYRLVADRHDGDTAARAQFQIGECLFAAGKHDDAVAELLKVDILHASPEWSAAALYEAGRCFEALNKAGEARAQYRDAIERFPQSAWAQPARERLAAITRAATPGRTGGQE